MCTLEITAIIVVLVRGPLSFGDDTIGTLEVGTLH